MDEEVCGDCKFFKTRFEDSGDCHRFPPVYAGVYGGGVLEGDIRFAFPEVIEIECCGEFKRK